MPPTFQKQFANCSPSQIVVDKLAKRHMHEGVDGIIFVGFQLENPVTNFASTGKRSTTPGCAWAVVTCIL